MSSIHDLAALAAEITVNRPDDSFRGDEIDGEKYDEEEDDIGGSHY